jgi:hypothetical protein
MAGGNTTGSIKGRSAYSIEAVPPKPHRNIGLDTQHTHCYPCRLAAENIRIRGFIVSGWLARQLRPITVRFAGRLRVAVVSALPHHPVSHHVGGL